MQFHSVSFRFGFRSVNQNRPTEAKPHFKNFTPEVVPLSGNKIFKKRFDNNFWLTVFDLLYSLPLLHFTALLCNRFRLLGTAELKPIEKPRTFMVCVSFFIPFFIVILYVFSV